MSRVKFVCSITVTLKDFKYLYQRRHIACEMKNMIFAIIFYVESLQFFLDVRNPI